jgi:uncharacterized protein (DUF2235 family)
VKRLAVFFDGTWNTPEDRTNVHNLCSVLAAGPNQRALYVKGVGTESGGLFGSFRALLGAAFGDGLSANIRQGYSWLVQNYEEGDEIFLFGFSRGAYSARSLAGLLRASGLLRMSGLLRENREALVGRAYENYRSGSPDAQPARAFRAEFSREVEIAFIGVWDTVGSLGIPIEGVALPGFQERYRFHSTVLSRRIRAAYHALAIHEFRSLYAPTLWTAADEPDKARPSDLPVEQRWFIGAHSNVGGGYEDDLFCNIPCRWIQRMAQRHGLQFSSDWPAGPDDLARTLHDSYAEFTLEHGELESVVKRQVRQLGSLGTLGETVDPSVRLQIQNQPTFFDDNPELKAALLKLPVGAE